jgi:dienelactone hydrolase
MPMHDDFRDPFSRGAYPVGVRTLRWTDSSRDRTLPIELYYPATDASLGRDRDPRTQDEFQPPGGFTGEARRKQSAVRDVEERSGTHPIVLFVHGYAGDRRECSFLCTHMASHGFRVVSADHIGSTYGDVQRQMAAPDFDRWKFTPRMIEDRFGDMRFLLAAAERELSTTITAVGVTGVSMGGWTSYIAPACDARVKAIVPLAPGGGAGPLTLGGKNFFGDAIDWKWKSEVAVMTLVADRDTWLPLYGQLKLFEACSAKDKVLVVLKDADHEHFCDDLPAAHQALREFTLALGEVDHSPGHPPWNAMAQMMLPYSQLMQEAEMNRIVAGLTTLHMIRVLKPPRSLMEIGPIVIRRELEARGLPAYVLELS